MVKVKKSVVHFFEFDIIDVHVGTPVEGESVNF